MERPGRNIKAILADLRYSAERSTMFWWFVENHDAIVETSAGQRISWATMSSRLAECGLTDRNGVCPKPHTARITWLRARKAVAAAAARSPPSAAGLAVARPMPRSPVARPLQADADEFDHSDDTQTTDQALGGSSVLASPVGSNLPITVSPSQVQTQESFAIQPVGAQPPAPVWTPEQIAHRDAMLAKARARLAHVDRFLNLRE